VKAALVVVLVLAVLALAWLQAPHDELSSVEIREYQGERLGSVADFRENSIKGPQDIDVGDYRLRVYGLVENPLELTYGEVLENENYSKVVTIYCVEGWDVKILWEGVLVRDLLEKAVPTEGAEYIIFRAADGYSTSFPASYVLDNDILMAHHMNGVTLDARRGFPFQLVAESKWGYKWIKWVTDIELASEEEIGYWESRGYSDSGNLNESFIG
jgi:DMSO/TMAO reductase YedYZ molybdopterin-dependent catalytic subunit